MKTLKLITLIFSLILTNLASVHAQCTPDITPPTGSNPVTLNVECLSDVPAPNVSIVTDEADNCTTPIVAFVGDVSDGLSCPETITRTYSITDNDGNFILVSQLIIVNDTQVPVFDPQPVDIEVQCSADVPVANDLSWNDNCDGTGASVASDVSDGASCPETITRTWTFTDNCGNVASASQSITVLNSCICNVGIGELNQENFTTLSPNPTSGQIKIEFDNNYENVLITIVDINGRIIEKTMLNITDEMFLNLNGDRGMYFVSVETGNKMEILRVIKE